MIRFEYKTIKVPDADQLEGILNALAADGWRYCGDTQSMGYTSWIILERCTLRNPIADPATRLSII